MKTISKILSIAMLLSASLQPAGYAQNLNKHIENATNVSIDYLKPSDEYVLGGITLPKYLGPYSNAGAFGGYLSRIQLEKIDNQLNNIWFKTYATADEVQAIVDGKCNQLSNYFTFGDAKQTKDEGYIICGRVRRDPETSGCGILGNYDNLFLLKTDKDGVVQWFKRYDDYGMLVSVVEAPNGDFIACGYLGSDGLGNGLIIYTDPSGNIQWSKEAQTPAYWDHDAIIGSQYYEVINYGDNFALVGIANTWGTVWGGTLITIVDGAGSYLQNSIIDNEPYAYTMVGRAIADAEDGEVVITGMAGTPCQTGAQVFLLKIEPYSMSVNYLRVYSANNFGDASMGSSVAVEKGNRIFVTGVDWTTDNNGGLYLETDYAGNLNRYNLHTLSAASWGKGIVFNQAGGYPTYSGNYFPASEPTFVVKNDQGYDCNPDIYMPDYSTPYDIYPSYDRDPAVKQIDDKALDFDLGPIEKIACGKAKKDNSTTAIATIVTAAIKLSPNPAGQYLDVDMGNTPLTGSTLKVYDITGRMLISRTVETGTSTRINTASLLPGMYTLNIVHQNGAVTRSNFIKE